MSQYVYSCACGWRGITIGGSRFHRGTAPAACGSCGSGALAVSRETHPRVTRTCGCGQAFLTTSRIADVQCAKCRGVSNSAKSWARRQKKYHWTPDRDAYLRQHYDGKVKRRTFAIAKVLGWPRYVIKRRAAQLGLSYHVDRRDYTPAEVAFIEEWTGSRTSKWIAKKLKRSETSVVLKQKRMDLSRRVRDGYTLDGLGECFGIDSHVVDRWVREGKLKGKRRGTDRTGKQGDIYAFTDDQVRAFIRNNPSAFRLDKVDQVWFLDLVLGAPYVSADLRRGKSDAAA